MLDWSVWASEGTEKWVFFPGSFLEYRRRHQPHLLMASVHALNLSTTINLLYSVNHIFAMSGKDNKNKWEADNFFSLLTVFPVTAHMQFKVSLSLFLSHTLIFPAVMYHFVPLLLMVWLVWFLLCSHLKAALASLHSQVLVKASFSRKE